MKNINEEIRACSIKPTRKTERGWEKTYIFPLDFLGFQGHFPGNPILPGIIQIMMARQAITEQMERKFEVAKVTRSKYMKVITPEIPVTMIWKVNEKQDALICKCTLEIEGNPASKLTMTLTSNRVEK
jgi:3-hydroxymyristoyl/3-hydroxydecanoyl-(acyl carrier protein) dehydratase